MGTERTPATGGNATFTANAVAHATNVHASGDNHDTDGDGNGASITIAKP